MLIHICSNSESIYLTYQIPGHNINDSIKRKLALDINLYHENSLGYGEHFLFVFIYGIIWTKVQTRHNLFYIMLYVA